MLWRCCSYDKSCPSPACLQVKHLSGLIEAATPRAEGEESVAAVHSQTQVQLRGLAGSKPAAGCTQPVPELLLQDTVTFCGRICCDSEGTLNHSSMLLEGSLSESQVRRLSRGMLTDCRQDAQLADATAGAPCQAGRVQTRGLQDLPRADSRSAGEQCHRGPDHSQQSVQATAKAHGRADSRSAVQHSYRALACGTLQAEQHWRAGSLPDSKPLAVLVAAGPFTGSAELSYEALDALLQQCSRVSAHALVLTGPFVDTEHPQVQAGSVDISFDQVFQEQVSQQVEPAGCCKCRLMRRAAAGCGAAQSLAAGLWAGQACAAGAKHTRCAPCRMPAAASLCWRAGVR